MQHIIVELHLSIDDTASPAKVGEEISHMPELLKSKNWNATGFAVSQGKLAATKTKNNPPAPVTKKVAKKVP